MYFDTGLFTLPAGAVFADVGCFDLVDTVHFARRCPDHGSIVALEPDPASWRVCQDAADRGEANNVTVLPYGAWHCRDTLSFNAFGNGASAVVQQAQSIDVVPLDEVFSGERVDLIKMDIEGAEHEALRGAEGFIRRERPVLAISAYHKPEDFISLPLLIHSIRDDYSFYFRSYSNSLVDRVLFAV